MSGNLRAYLGSVTNSIFLLSLASVVMGTSSVSAITLEEIIRGENNVKTGIGFAYINVDGDSAPERLIGAPFYPDPQQARGAVYLLDNEDALPGIRRLSPPFNSYLRLVDSPTSGDRMGASIAVYKDLNNDGFPEAVVGIPGFAGNKGKVEIWDIRKWKDTGTLDRYSLFTSVLISGDDGGCGTAIATDPARNFIYVATPLHGTNSNTPNDRGMVEVIELKCTAATCPTNSLTAAGALTETRKAGIEGQDTETCGLSIAALGDIDANGADELAIGCPSFNGAGSHGRVFIKNVSATGAMTAPSSSLLPNGFLDAKNYEGGGITFSPVVHGRFGESVARATFEIAGARKPGLVVGEPLASPSGVGIESGRVWGFAKWILGADRYNPVAHPIEMRGFIMHSGKSVAGPGFSNLGATEPRALAFGMPLAGNNNGWGFIYDADRVADASSFTGFKFLIGGAVSGRANSQMGRAMHAGSGTNYFAVAASGADEFDGQTVINTEVLDLSIQEPVSYLGEARVEVSTPSAPSLDMPFSGCQGNTIKVPEIVPQSGSGNPLTPKILSGPGAGQLCRRPDFVACDPSCDAFATPNANPPCCKFMSGPSNGQYACGIAGSTTQCCVSLSEWAMDQSSCTLDTPIATPRCCMECGQPSYSVTVSGSGPDNFPNPPVCCANLKLAANNFETDGTAGTNGTASCLLGILADPTVFHINFAPGCGLYVNALNASWGSYHYTNLAVDDGGQLYDPSDPCQGSSPPTTCTTTAKHVTFGNVYLEPWLEGLPIYAQCGGWHNGTTAFTLNQISMTGTARMIVRP